MSNLSLVHTLYEGYSLWHNLVIKFPKAERYTLGQQCSEKLLGALEFVLAAATTSERNEKISNLVIASRKLDTLKLLVRLAKDCQCLENKRYLAMEHNLHTAGKMLGAWLKAERNKMSRQ